MLPTARRTILIVEDEQHLAQGLRFNLEAEGYAAEVADTGESALALLASSPDRFCLIVLDVMLPGVDGFTVASELRQRGQYVPILILTARGGAEDVVRGFESGADDYLPKPFELSVLLARVQALLRRREWLREAGPVADPPADLVFDVNGKTIDFATMEIHSGSATLPLTLMEANLLRYLVRHRGEPVSRKTLLEEVWGVHEDADTRAIDNFIVRLRRYLEDDPAKPRYLQTVRGVGYRFTPPTESTSEK